MASKTYKADIIIFGAGVAGLWLHHRFSKAGYNSLLLETDAIGGQQSIASQGILHSGLKYTLAGKVNKLAQSISAMPDRWRAAMQHYSGAEVDLTRAAMMAPSQLLMIPDGFMGGLIKIVTEKTLGNGVTDIPRDDWPDGIAQSGFKGRLVSMGEPVLNAASVMRALAEPYQRSIRRIDMDFTSFDQDDAGDISSIWIDDEHEIKAQHVIFTAAASNAKIARMLGHDEGLKTQARPLLMGMLRPAPFDCFAHLVGPSDKPVATITTHYDHNKQRVWYVGAAVAERAKEDDPRKVRKAMMDALKKYMPAIDVSHFEWATLPIDRIEGASETDGWMPDTPTVHRAGNAFYCWPTKLTFAPMLGDKLAEFLPAPQGVKAADWSFLEEAPFAPLPWDALERWNDD